MKRQRPTVLSMSKGFTLIEILIASTIFALVAVVGAATLTSVNKVDKEIKVERSRQQAVRYVLEALSREVRFAQTIDVNTSLNQLTITTKDAPSKTYRLDSGKITDGTTNSLTSSNVTVTSFSLAGEDTNPTSPGYVKITISTQSTLDPADTLEAETIAVPRGYNQ